MCGIAGYYGPAKPDRGAQGLMQMLGAIAHRGPDDQGLLFVDSTSGALLDCATARSDPRIREQLPTSEAAHGFVHDLAFAHCRYSVVDLTPAGHQPMWDAAREACVSFNGEIYNYLELREELEKSGRRFRTRSDTEVILAGYLAWGTKVFNKMNGQWALALYDSRSRTLLLSRDRLGKVPLYYATHGGRLYWASEIKAILQACGSGAFATRGQAVHDFVVEGWRDRDGTFWSGIEDFPAASFARVGADLRLQIERYWKLPGARLSHKDVSVAEAAEKIRGLLADAIALRLRADVPVAFELSGGMDSSALVAMAAQRDAAQLTTYTIAFDDPEFNEEPFARAVAARFAGKIDYRIIRPGKDEFWRDADEFIQIEEEPFHAPNLHANQALRRQMKQDGARVVISGSAGDEVFAGYAGEYLAPFLRYLATSLRWRELLKEARSNTEYRPGLRRSAALAMDAFAPRLERRLSRLRSGERALLEGCYRAPADSVTQGSADESFNARMLANMGFAKMNYWLRSANKANFGIPIEARAPYLDYRLLEFAFCLPAEYLIRDGWHKWILRQTVADLLPPEVLWRRTKLGFPFPLSQWLLASRAHVAKNLAGLECPYLDSKRLLERYDEFAKRVPHTLWRLVSLGLWWRRVVEGRSIATEGP